jgi:hypothetical protein
MPSTSGSPPVDLLIDAILRSSAQLNQITDHMAAYSPYASPDSLPPAEILRRLLGDVLAPLGERRAAEVATAAGVLSDALDVMAEEIYLVPPPTI